MNFYGTLIDKPNIYTIGYQRSLENNMTLKSIIAFDKIFFFYYVFIYFS